MEQASRSQMALVQGEQARRMGQSDAARTAFAEAIAACRAEGDLLGEARALAGQAHIAREAGNLDWALHDQTEAIVLFRRIGDGPALATALRDASDMFVAAGRLTHAAAQLQEALDLYRACLQSPPLDCADALRSVALLAEALGEPEQARHFWSEARMRYAELDPLFFRGEDSRVHEAEMALARLGG